MHYLTRRDIIIAIHRRAENKLKIYQQSRNVRVANNKLEGEKMETKQTTAVNASVDSAAIRHRIKGLLLNLNFRNKLVGTRYLEDALLIKLLCPKQFIKTMDLYAAIARYHHTKAGNVERAIRNTIADCHNNKTLQKINKELGYDICDPHYPPTNSDFITEVAIRMIYVDQEKLTHAADFTNNTDQLSQSTRDAAPREATHSQW